MGGIFTTSMFTGRESFRECSHPYIRGVCKHSQGRNLHGFREFLREYLQAVNIPRSRPVLTVCARARDGKQIENGWTTPDHAVALKGGS